MSQTVKPTSEQEAMEELRFQEGMDGSQSLHQQIGALQLELASMRTSQAERDQKRWQDELNRSNLSHKERDQSLQNSIEAIRRAAVTNWPLIIILGGAGFAILAFIVNSMVQPLNSKTEILSEGINHNAIEIQTLRDAATKSSAADAASQIDRANLNTKTLDNTRLISELSQKTASMAADFVSRTTEVETQVDGTAQAAAIQFADTSRELNELRTAVSLLGGKIPASTNDPYIFPNMSNREHKLQ
jgi:hypothetical protein